MKTVGVNFIQEVSQDAGSRTTLSIWLEVQWEDYV